MHWHKAIVCDRPPGIVTAMERRVNSPQLSPILMPNWLWMGLYNIIAQ